MHTANRLPGFIAIAVSSTLSVAGCATIVVVDTVSPESIQAEVRAGDEIRLTTHSEAFFELSVEQLTDFGIEAYDANQQFVAVPYEDVARISMRKSRPGRTAAAVAGGIGAAAVILYAMVGVVLASVLSGGF